MNTNDLNNSFSSNAFKVDFADETLRNKLRSSLERDEIWEAKKIVIISFSVVWKKTFPGGKKHYSSQKREKENIYRFKK